MQDIQEFDKILICSLIIPMFGAIVAFITAFFQKNKKDDDEAEKKRIKKQAKKIF